MRAWNYATNEHNYHSFLHNDLHAKGLRNDQNVGEDDGGVKETSITFDWLQSDPIKDII